MAEERSSRSGERGSESSRSESRGGRGGEETFRQGETPGAGEYECTTCEPSWKVTLDSDEKRLPPCGRCGPGTTAEYERVGRSSRSEGSRGGSRGKSEGERGRS